MNTRSSRLKSKIRKSPAGALFSSDRKHRYLLWRSWSGVGRLMLFVGLNPSVADEVSNDPTIRRIMGFARRERSSGVLVANLFSLCATHPRELKLAEKPLLRDNDKWLFAAQELAATTVVCWGSDGAHLGRSDKVLASLGTVSAFGQTKTGEPKHPLYLRRDAMLRPVR